MSAGRLRWAAAALALCLLAGCTAPEDVLPEEPSAPSISESPASVQTPFSLPYYPAASLHPITGDNRTNAVLTCLVYQGLFELDNTFTAHPVLCRTWTTSEDGLTWTFTLNAVSFSDGSPLTAADAAASLELARSSVLYGSRLADVRAVSAEEDAVVVTLTAPNGRLPALLDVPIVRAVEDGLPLGTGPYVFAEAGAEGGLKLVRRSAAPNTAPAEIPLTAIQSADELIYAFDSRDVSLVVSDLTGTNALGYSTGYESFHFPTTTLLYVGFQTRRGDCRDALVRQAIFRTFDRDTVTVSLLAGHADAAVLPVSPRCDLYDSNLAAAGDYDPTAAAELLAQAGYTAGEDGMLYYRQNPLALTFVVNTDNAFKLSIAEYLAGQLTSQGITVELERLSWEDYVTALERGNFDLFLGEVTLTADFNLTALLSRDGALNYGGWSSAETETLLAQLRASDTEHRTEAAAALFEHLLAEAPLAPLCFKTNAVLTQWGAVSGLEPTRQNPFYGLEQLRFEAQT